MEKGKALSLIREYLDRAGKAGFPSTTHNPKLSGFGLAIVIPCYEEEKINLTLNSLSSCSKPDSYVKLILVINQPESSGKGLRPANRESKNQIINSLQNFPDWFSIDIIEALDLPEKKAGVGLARKIGMDHVCEVALEEKNSQLPIICLDADCIVDHNYLLELEKHFEEHPNTPGASIYFEHPLAPENSEAIKLYELRLRFYLQALRFAGFPYAFQTVGSSMACRAEAYAMQGGMNQRKAGEDFYFLHKIIPLGNFTEIYTTKVIPSSRISTRVPFGTGRAMGNFLSGSEDLGKYYDLKSVLDLKVVLENVFGSLGSTKNFKTAWDKMPDSFKDFISREEWILLSEEIFNHAKTSKNRLKRFFSWLDGFRILKFMHQSRDNFYPNSNLLENSKKLLELMGIAFEEIALEEVLGLYRGLEQKPWTSPLDKLGEV